MTARQVNPAQSANGLETKAFVRAPGRDVVGVCCHLDAVMTAN